MLGMVWRLAIYGTPAWHVSPPCSAIVSLLQHLGPVGTVPCVNAAPLLVFSAAKDDSERLAGSYTFVIRSAMAAPAPSPLHFASTGIACIALISARNTPIYLRAFPSSPAAASAAAATAPSLSSTQHTNVRYEYIANAALDLVEERTSRHAEHYLGLLMTMEDLAVYGFQTSSRVKILVMLPATDLFVRDIDLLTMFRALHTAYLSYIANPFHLLPPIIPSSSSTATSTAVFHPAPTPHSQPASIFSTDPALEQIAALQSLSCRPIRSANFEAHVDRIVGWTPVPPAASAAASASSGRTIGAGKALPVDGAAVQGSGGVGAGQNPAVPVS